MKKYLTGICAEAAVLMQAEAALAGCTQADVTGAWNLVGTLLGAFTSTTTSAISCAAVLVTKGTGTTKLSISASACITQDVQAANHSWTISADNTLTLNAHNCRVTGSFLLTPSGESSDSMVITSGTFSRTPATGTRTQGQVVAAASPVHPNDLITAFTLLR
jgi:hypothetical protein